MVQLLIVKNNISEIKKFCERKGINYELYTSPLNYSQLHAEKVKVFADYDKAIKDQELEAEKAKLEQADENDEYDEYEQEE